MTDTKHFEVGDECEQLGRTFRLTDAGWKRVNRHTGGVSELTPLEHRLFSDAKAMANAEHERVMKAERELAERAMRRALG